MNSYEFIVNTNKLKNFKFFVYRILVYYFLIRFRTN